MYFWILFHYLFLIVIVDSASSIKCRYNKNENYEYTCTINKQKFTTEDEAFIVTSEDGKFFSDNHELKQVIFEDTKMSFVPTEIFKIFPNLRKLSLEQTGLRNWKRKNLEGARNLKSLVIWSSLIEEFDEESFAEVPRLESLSIWMSEMRIINPAMLRPLTHLKELDLRHNFLILLTENAFDPIAATASYINLSRTFLERIPPGIFKKFKKLVEVDLSENNLLPIDANLTFPATLQKVSVCKCPNHGLQILMTLVIFLFTYS